MPIYYFSKKIFYGNEINTNQIIPYFFRKLSKQRISNGL